MSPARIYYPFPAESSIHRSRPSPAPVPSSHQGFCHTPAGQYLDHLGYQFCVSWFEAQSLFPNNLCRTDDLAARALLYKYDCVEVITLPAIRQSHR